MCINVLWRRQPHTTVVFLDFSFPFITSLLSSFPLCASFHTDLSFAHWVGGVAVVVVFLLHSWMLIIFLSAHLNHFPLYAEFLTKGLPTFFPLFFCAFVCVCVGAYGLEVLQGKGK
ncbi:hypothetical protein, unlikely [Trypanosoma brucei gambiense DAL972]|uniref:Uncharacterized protein n=1 Tax=Trypanosoma brucei gambiense (strain MHOM/CI/86/DAL972) TaxID=679716 RepID=C9ZU97_TRYB9|nr:hypothetical protein, unlikely [Trypanosoma brucei gambiense DAL972]CBH12984.1 hypothetical protein, unlikely [Trypanosoma brucei gambiense DAL972]|eukprot:XP_011775262.1 hypothetical protein, unlikely [Trypanosoma brucei gambiense DAL972]